MKWTIGALRGRAGILGVGLGRQRQAASAGLDLACFASELFDALMQTFDCPLALLIFDWPLPYQLTFRLSRRPGEQCRASGDLMPASSHKSL
jgi:hypothetical protein